MDNFCLKWDEFEKNIRECFRTLRDNQKSFDVTLATDDGHQIQAHKIILTVGSNFFSDIFTSTNHSNVLVYLKGISSCELEPVLDFLYNGEASVAGNDLKMFFKTGKELRVKGLEGELKGISEHFPEQPQSQQVTPVTLIEHESDGTNSQERFDSPDSEVDITEPVDTKNEDKIKIKSSGELDVQIQDMMERNEGMWKCRVCGKSAYNKGHIQEHVETHIEGVYHACDICSKIFPNRKGIRNHKYNSHKLKAI